MVLIRAVCILDSVVQCASLKHFHSTPTNSIILAEAHRNKTKCGLKIVILGNKMPAVMSVKKTETSCWLFDTTEGGNVSFVLQG